MEQKFCIYCGKMMATEANFCPYCGKRQPVCDTAAKEIETEAISVADETPTPVAEPIAAAPEVSPAPKKERKFSITTLVRNSVILIVAITMLVFAFLPIIKFEAEYAGVDIELKISPVNQVVLLFDSFLTLDDEDIEETRLYERSEEIIETLYDEGITSIDDISEEDKKLLSELSLIVMRLMVQHEDFSAPVVYYVSSVFAIIYILNAVALLILALLNLFASLKLIGGAEDKMYKWTTRALTLTPVLLMTAFYCINISLGENLTPKMSGGAILTLILSSATILTAFVLRFVLNKSARTLRLIPRAIAITLSIVVICLAFAPALQTSIHTTFNGSEKAKTAEIAMGASFFTLYHVTDDVAEKLEDMIEYDNTKTKQEKLAAIFDRFEDLTRKESEGVLGISVNSELLITLIGSKTRGETLELISLIGIVFIGAFIGAALVLWQNLSYLMNEQYSKNTVLISKIVSAVLALGALGISIAYLIVVRELETTYLPKGFDISISAGVICLAIFAIGSIFCPHNVTPRVKKIDTEEVEEPVEEVIEQAA